MTTQLSNIPLLEALTWHKSYLTRHVIGSVARCFYYRLRRDRSLTTRCIHGVPVNKSRAKYDAFKRLWNRLIHSIRRIPAYKPDPVHFDKANESICLIDFTVPFPSLVGSTGRYII